MATGSLLHDQELARYHASIDALRRDIFTGPLARLLAIQPSDEKLQEFANKAPDRLAQAVAIYARCRGYSERIEVEQTGLLGFAVKLQGLSDAELEAMHAARQRARVDQKPPSKKILELPAAKPHDQPRPEAHHETPEISRQESQKA